MTNQECIKRGEEMFADGWRFAPGSRSPKQGRRKGWLTFVKEGVNGLIQVHPEIGDRIKELEVKE